VDECKPLVTGDRTYKIMIERYPKNSRVLRSYGRFLEEVRSDPRRVGTHAALLSHI